MVASAGPAEPLPAEDSFASPGSGDSAEAEDGDGVIRAFQDLLSRLF